MTHADSAPTIASQPTALTDFLPNELAERLDLKPYQGLQLFEWLHGKGQHDFNAMTNLSKELRARLAASCRGAQLTARHTSDSPRSHGTRKMLFQLHDGETVEAVLIRDRDRATLCLSSQVGCAVKCSFCATGMSGYTRHLSPGEIAEQAIRLIHDNGLHGKTPNIVYMGMGEPMRNYDAVRQSVRMLMHKRGLNIGARRITVSTVGEVPGIEQFAAEPWQVRLSVSLHAANNTLRNQLIPLNKKYPLERLMPAIEAYIRETDRQVTFEWTLLEDVNDRIEDARELLDLAGPLKAFVNLIPYNPVEGLPYRTPPRKKCEAFAAYITQRGLKATLRKERGQDINAACGQLRRHAAHSGLVLG